MVHRWWKALDHQRIGKEYRHPWGSLGLTSTYNSTFTILSEALSRLHLISEFLKFWVSTWKTLLLFKDAFFTMFSKEKDLWVFTFHHSRGVCAPSPKAPKDAGCNCGGQKITWALGGGPSNIKTPLWQVYHLLTSMWHGMYTCIKN